MCGAHIPIDNVDGSSIYTITVPFSWHHEFSISLELFNAWAFSTKKQTSVKLILH